MPRPHHKVTQPLGNGYRMQVGVIRANGNFEKRVTLPSWNSVKHVDGVRGGSLERLTVVRSEAGVCIVLVRKPPATRLCDRCPGKHSSLNLHCSANFLPQSPMTDPNAVYSIVHGDIFARIGSVGVLHTSFGGAVKLCSMQLT